MFPRFWCFFSVDFIEARTERKKTIMNDENSIYWKGVWKKGTGPLYSCCSSIDQKLWSLDKYIDNLWEVVKYKKKNQTSHFYQAPEKLQIVNHTTFFLLICRLIQKNGSKKERKKKKSTFCTAMLKSKTPDRISSVQRYYRVTVKYA